MRHRSFCLALVGLVLGAANVWAQDTKVDVDLSGLQEGQTVQLALVTGESPKAFVSVPLHKGKGTIAFDAEGARGYYLQIDSCWTGELLVLDKGDHATLKAKAVKVGEKGNVYYDLDDVTVKGSKMTDEYHRLKLNRDSLNAIHDEIYKNPVVEAYGKAYEAKDSVKIQELKQSEEWKRFVADDKAFLRTVQDAFKACHERSKNSWFGPFLMLVNYSYLSENQKPEFDDFPEEVKNTYYGKIVHDQICPPTHEGEAMPDFSYVDHATGQNATLKETLQGKKYLLLDFWASWCRPCRKEIPNIKANYERYHDKGFQVLSISGDRKEADWLKALNEEQLPWPNGRDADETISSLYKIKYYPTIYLLDAEGKVVAKDIRGEELGKKLAELFNE